MRQLRPYRAAPGPNRLGAIVQNVKPVSTRRINQARGTPGLPVWQRGYYEHIVRTPRALDAIRRYIETNPQRWAQDLENRI